MPNFQRALALADCPVGSSREVVVGERIVALYNVDGTIHALDGVCPHQGGPLGKGCLKGAVVTCPWHGWQFDVRTGQHQFSASVIQPRFEVRIEGDAILVDVEPEGIAESKTPRELDLALISYRSFRNTDPPALADVWRQSAPERGFMQPMSVELLERHVLSKPYFDRHGLIVAEREGRVVGFAHAGFGASDDFSTLSRLFGVVCLILVRPEGQRAGVGSELLSRAEAYLRASGSEVIYAGAVHPLDPFYLGLYGGSELPGVLDSLQAAHPFLIHRGYDEVDRVVVLERDLADFRPLVDRNQMQIRRKTNIDAQSDPSSSTWWEACNYGCFDRVRFELKNRENGKRIARATGWMLDPISRTWGVRAVGLVDLEVDEAHRRQGLASFLLGESFRRLQEQGVMMVQVQTMQRNTAALALYQKLGFHQTDGGTVYRKRAS